MTVVEDEVGGMPIEYDNVPELTGVLTSLLVSPDQRRRLTSAGARRVRERHIFEAFSLRTAQLLSVLVKE